MAKAECVVGVSIENTQGDRLTFLARVVERILTDDALTIPPDETQSMLNELRMRFPTSERERSKG